MFPFGLPLQEDADTGGKFDGAVCSAVLMHVPETELFDSTFSLRRVLKEKGKLLISVSGPRQGVSLENRDDTGRLFRTLDPEFMMLMFERVGFQVLRRWEESDRLGRAGMRWNCFLFELDTARGRPLDRIEGGLNRDRKAGPVSSAQ